MKYNNLKCGLFCACRHYIKDLKIFIKRIFFTLRHGYSPVAKWETFKWFIDVMKEILHKYRYNRCGTQIVIDNYWDEDGNCCRDEENEKAYDTILDEMLDCLDRMDESNYIYEDMDYMSAYNLQCQAKDNFFRLFSKYFYGFWD